MIPQVRVLVVVVAWAVLAVPACSDGDDGEAAGTTTASTTTTTTVPPLVSVDERTWEVDWSALEVTPYFGYDEETNPEDPFWLINNDAESAGFALSLELYTTGFGEEWTGETGVFELSCSESGTGICLHFDPDAEGSAPDLNADFEATGVVEIEQLDDDGYDLVLRDVEFSDGTRLAGPVELSGSA